MRRNIAIQPNRRTPCGHRNTVATKSQINQPLVGYHAVIMYLVSAIVALALSGQNVTYRIIREMLAPMTESEPRDGCQLSSRIKKVRTPKTNTSGRGFLPRRFHLWTLDIFGHFADMSAFCPTGQRGGRIGHLDMDILSLREMSEMSVSGPTWTTSNPSAAGLVAFFVNV